MLPKVGQAHAVYRSAGDRLGQAQTLTAIGWSHAYLGNYRQALVCCRRALPLLKEFDDREGQAYAWESIGHAHHHLGDHVEVATCYGRALDLCRGLGDRYLEAHILNHLGDTHHAAHDPAAAAMTWRRALDVFTELDRHQAGRIRVKLAALDEPSGAPGAPDQPTDRTTARGR